MAPALSLLSPVSLFPAGMRWTLALTGCSTWCERLVCIWSALAPMSSFHPDCCHCSLLCAFVTVPSNERCDCTILWAHVLLSLYHHVPHVRQCAVVTSCRPMCYCHCTMRCCHGTPRPICCHSTLLMCCGHRALFCGEQKTKQGHPNQAKGRGPRAKGCPIPVHF